MAFSVTQNFDGVSAPNLPTGWTYGVSLVTTASTNFSAPNSLTMSGGISHEIDMAVYSTTDTSATSWTISCVVSLTQSNSYAGPCWNSSSDGSTCYYGKIAYSSTGSAQYVEIIKRVSSSETILATIQPGVSFLTSGRWYTFAMSGSQSGATMTMTATVVDSTNGYYLTSSGTWQAGATNAFSLSDGSGVTPNYFGVALSSATGGSTVFADNISITTSDGAGITKVPWHLFFESR
jgi:hypothetical protein